MIGVGRGCVGDGDRDDRVGCRRGGEPGSDRQVAALGDAAAVADLERDGCGGGVVVGDGDAAQVRHVHAVTGPGAHCQADGAGGLSGAVVSGGHAVGHSSVISGQRHSLLTLTIGIDMITGAGLGDGQVDCQRQRRRDGGHQREHRGGAFCDRRVQRLQQRDDRRRLVISQHQLRFVDRQTRRDARDGDGRVGFVDLIIDRRQRERGCAGRGASRDGDLESRRRREVHILVAGRARDGDAHRLRSVETHRPGDCGGDRHDRVRSSGVLGYRRPIQTQVDLRGGVVVADRHRQIAIYRRIVRIR